MNTPAARAASDAERMRDLLKPLVADSNVCIEVPYRSPALPTADSAGVAA
jgi:hypothetical protein